jgi:hypothetical protein
MTKKVRIKSTIIYPTQGYFPSMEKYRKCLNLDVFVREDVNGKIFFSLSLGSLGKHLGKEKRVQLAQKLI